MMTAANSSESRVGETSTVTAYPLPPGATLSDLYAVTVNGVDVPVERTLFYQGVHIAAFAVSYPCTVRVKCPTFSLPQTVLRPMRHFKEPVRNPPWAARDSCVEFTLNEARPVMLEACDPPDRWPLLLLFADDQADVERTRPEGRTERFRPQALAGYQAPGFSWEPDRSEPMQAAVDSLHKAGGGTLVLGPGLYAYENGARIPQLEIPAGVTLHLEAGAKLQGRLIAVRGDRAGITGQGIVSGGGIPRTPAFKHHHRFACLEMCNHVRVDGVRFEQSPYWCLFAAQCRHLTIENTKVVNSALGPRFVQGTDQYHFYNCEDVRVDRVFAMGSDDVVVINAEGRIPSRRFDVSNVTSYSLGGARIHTAEAGVSDIRFRDFDVLSSVLPLNIDLCDAGHLRDVHFEDFFVERIGHYARPLPFLWIGWEDQVADPSTIENVTARNIHMPDMQDVQPNTLRPRMGGNADRGQVVKNVTIQGLFFGDKPVLRPEDGGFDMRNTEKVRFLPLESGQ